MIKSKQISEINDRIKQLEDERIELVKQRGELNKCVLGKLDAILSDKFGIICSGIAIVLSNNSHYYMQAGWENSIDAPALRLICDEYFGGEEHTGEHIKQLISKGVLIEKFYWMNEDEDCHILDDDLQTRMKNVIILQESGIDNFPVGTEHYEKTPFDPILGESCSLEEMKDGMIPIWFATQEFLDAIKEAEQTLVDTGEFEYV